MNEPNFLFLHVPKYSNYYKPLDDFMFINYLPMGVLALCDLLNKNGISARIKHLGLETILAEDFSIAAWVKAHGTRIVGISLHWHYQSFDVIDVAQKIKQASPQTAIILGGFTASRFASEILAHFTAVDAILAGDAEGGIIPLAQTILRGERDFSSVANCVWRSGEQIVDNGLTYTAQAADLDALDYANLDLLDHAQKYRDYFRFPMFWMNNASLEQNLKRRVGAEWVFPLAIGRGCPVNCSFCGGNCNAQKRLFNRSKPVFRSVEAVIDSMKKALAFGYNSFIVCFDPTPQDDRYYLDLMAAIRAHNIHCGFAFESWSLPSRAFVDAFRQTFDLRNSYIAISPETGSEEIRKANKGFYYSNQEIYQTLDYMLAQKVPVRVYLALGLPGESSAHLKQSAQFARQLRKRYRKILLGIYCLPIQIEPAAAIFEDPATHGIISDRQCFMDFYHSHSRTDTGPYTYHGYTSPSLSSDHETFAKLIQAERCQNYCLIMPKILSQFESGRLARFLCHQNYLSWQRKGLGKPAAERKTFR